LKIPATGVANSRISGRHLRNVADNGISNDFDGILPCWIRIFMAWL
jgi:hypothetical protein